MVTLLIAVCAPRVEAQTFRIGSFTKTTASAPASQTVPHNLGVTPKALILWSDGNTNQSFSANYLLSVGFVDGTTSGSVATASENGQASQQVVRRMANKALTFVQWGPTVLAEADLTSWDATNFYLNWTTNNATGYVIHYLAIGGSGVSAKVLLWSTATVTGNQSVTGAGFQPSLVLHAHAGGVTGTLPVNQVSGAFGLGAMDAAGHQWMTAFYSNTGANTTQRAQLTTSPYFTVSSPATIQKIASFVSMDADGFTLNFSGVDGTASDVFSLALTGINLQVGSFTKNTTSASGCSSGCPQNAITGVGFQPSAVLLSSFQDVANPSAETQTRFAMGAADETSEGSLAVEAVNAANPTNVQAIDKTSKAFIKVNNSTPVIDAEADLASMDTNGFTLNWTTNDTAATQILYVALGPLGATSVTLESFHATLLADGRILIQWRTGYEVDNVGFRLFREQAGQRVRLTSSLVPGAALLRAGQRPTTRGQSYECWDVISSNDGPPQYWLEDVDLHGKHTWHGPIVPLDPSR